MSDFNFIKFTDVGKRFEDRITVTRSRSIGFPTQFYKSNHVGSFKFGILYYDSKSNAIGIKLSNNESEEGRINIVHSDKYGGHMLANSFFKANRINAKRFAGRYDYDMKPLRELGIDEDGDLFIIKLKEMKSGGGDVE